MNVTYKEETNNPTTTHRFITEHWEVDMKDTESQKLKKEIEKLVDKHKDWDSALNIEFTKMMTLAVRKNGTLKITDIKFEENLTSIIQTWKEKVKLREKSNQSTLNEIDVKLGKVKPSMRIPITPKKKK